MSTDKASSEIALLKRDVPAHATDEAEGTPFYIPSSGPSARPRSVLKHGDTFAVFDSHGDMGASAGGPDGLFDHDTRYLSRLELLIDGVQPILLGSRVLDNNLTLTADLTNPDVYYDNHIVLRHNTIHIVRTAYIWKGAAHQRISISNHSASSVPLLISLSFANDFADLFEARGQRRARRGKLDEQVASPERVVYDYMGLDNVARRSALHLEPAPTNLLPSAALYRFQLAPHESRNIFLAVYCHGARTPLPITYFRGLMAANRQRRNHARMSAQARTSNGILNEALNRAAADLNMLNTLTRQGPYPYAGIPWYSTTFGRDGLITALQLLWCDPAIAKGVLARLAARQATSFDAEADAEPGKILHEMRSGEMAALKEVPFGLYYGSVDSTPLFLILLGAYVGRTGDEATLRELWPAALRALEWMRTSGDLDGDGFLEYQGAGSDGLHHGLRNQGWKDSFDAIFHADGTLAQGSVALCEVQGYAYAAKLSASRCAGLLGFDDLAQKLASEAEQLAQKFEEAFWCEEMGFYAIALDGKKEQCRVRASNAGQLLWTGIVRPDRARRVADALMSPAFFSGWGIRTLAKGEARYNPMSYHNGSVWPHDNSLIALGFAKYGFHDYVEKVFEATFAAASYMELRRLPELYCGFRRRPGAGATLYPVACSPQAWASGSLFLMIQAALGIEFEPRAREIRFRNPHLPPSFNQIVLMRLSMNGVAVDIELHGAGRRLSLRTLRSVGEVQVSMVVS